MMKKSWSKSLLFRARPEARSSLTTGFVVGTRSISFLNRPNQRCRTSPTMNRPPHEGQNNFSKARRRGHGSATVIGSGVERRQWRRWSGKEAAMQGLEPHRASTKEATWRRSCARGSAWRRCRRWRWWCRGWGSAIDGRAFAVCAVQGEIRLLRTRVCDVSNAAAPPCSGSPPRTPPPRRARHGDTIEVESSGEGVVLKVAKEIVIGSPWPRRVEATHRPVVSAVRSPEVSRLAGL